MPKRRDNGEGNVYQRPDGLWEGRVRYTDPQTGARRRVSVYGPTPKAARAKLKQARDRLEVGAPPKDAARIVGDWLAHWRSTTLAASDRKDSTKELYAKGEPVDPRNLLRIIETAASAAGVQGAGVHTLRHSAAVAWLESGVHIRAVAICSATPRSR